MLKTILSVIDTSNAYGVPPSFASQNDRVRAAYLRVAKVGIVSIIRNRLPDTG